MKKGHIKPPPPFYSSLEHQSESEVQNFRLAGKQKTLGVAKSNKLPETKLQMEKEDLHKEDPLKQISSWRKIA